MRGPLVSFGIGWFFVTLLPVCHVIPHPEIAAEHHLYLPSVGFALLVGLAVVRVASFCLPLPGERAGVRGPRRSRPALAYATLVLFALVLTAAAYRTHLRNEDWRDPYVFWGKVVETAPRCARAQFNLATYAFARGERVRALEAARVAAGLRPSWVGYRAKYASLLDFHGDRAAAAREYTQALRLLRVGQPASSGVKGAVFEKNGLMREAVNAFRKAVWRVPGDFEAAFGLARCLVASGQVDQGAAEYDRYLERWKPNVQVLIHAAAAHELAGHPERARELRARAIELAREQDE